MACSSLSQLYLKTGNMGVTSLEENPERTAEHPAKGSSVNKALAVQEIMLCKNTGDTAEHRHAEGFISEGRRKNLRRTLAMGCNLFPLLCEYEPFFPLVVYTQWHMLQYTLQYSVKRVV